MPGSHLQPSTKVESLVRTALTRSHLILAAEQLAIAFSLVCGGGVLLLLAGTQILSWYWLLLLAVAGVAAGWVRFRRRAILPYRVAQLLDSRLGLHDTISTAWFLQRGDSPRSALTQDTKSGLAQTQLLRAERVAETTDPGLAFPVTGQRAWAAAGTLGVVALTLFGVRYFVDHTLDLKKPLIPMPQLESVLASVEKRFLPPHPEPGDHDQLDAQGNNRDAHTESDDPRLNDVLGVKNQNGANAASSEPTAGQSPSEQKLEAANGDQSQNGENGKDANGTAEGQQSPNGQPQPMGAPPPGSQPQTGQPQGQSQPAPGLMDKMKDAMSSLVSKMKPSSSPQSAQNPGKQPNNGDDADKNAAAKGDQAQAKQQGASNQQSGEEANAQGEENSQTAERAQNAQGRSSDRASDKNGSDAHSGAGRQDGAKELKEAQQQEAMGKLAEIIGKRSANLTGEVMVEVPNGKQQLQTKYSQKVGHHSDLGGEINRDEVPLMYQQYVREYMEQVHKQAKSLK